MCASSRRKKAQLIGTHDAASDQGVVNMGLGRDVAIKQKHEGAADSTKTNSAAITGQKAVVTRARRSIAGFKLRGCRSVSMTLRGQHVGF